MALDSITACVTFCTIQPFPIIIYNRISMWTQFCISYVYFRQGGRWWVFRWLLFSVNSVWQFCKALSYCFTDSLYKESTSPGVFHSCYHVLNGLVKISSLGTKSYYRTLLLLVEAGWLQMVHAIRLNFANLFLPCLIKFSKCNRNSGGGGGVVLHVHNVSLTLNLFCSFCTFRSFFLYCFI